MKVRAGLSSVAAVLALAASVVAFGGGEGADATQGQAILAGQINTETAATVVQNTNVSVPDCSQTSGTGLLACGDNGVVGRGIGEGVLGIGAAGVIGAGTSSYGVEGTSNTGGGVFGFTGAEGKNGVFGQADNSGGSGVYGQNDATGYGVAGRATNAGGGTGVLGDAPNSAAGVGVEADSATGTALHVNGKAVFSRSGIVTIAAGNNTRTVTLAGVTNSSMVLATAQQSKAVYVKAVIPAAGSFKVFLTGKAPTGGLRVAYFVLN